MKILGISEKQIIKFLSIFSKRNFFYTLKQQHFFVSFYSFEGVPYFWVKLWIVFSKLLSAANQQLFYATEDDIGQGPSNHAPLLYKLLVLVLRFTLSLGDVKDLQKNALKIQGTRSKVDIFTSDKTFVLFFLKKIIFPALIDNPNNSEIYRMIRLVVHRMFLLPYSASLMKNALKIFGTSSTVDILASSNFFWIIFPALIDNPNNLEINRLITLVVSEMFLLPYSALLMSFSSF